MPQARRREVSIFAPMSFQPALFLWRHGFADRQDRQWSRRHCRQGRPGRPRSGHDEGRV